MIAINGFNICLFTSSFLFLWDNLAGKTDFYQIVTQLNVLVGFTGCHEGKAQCFLRGSCLTLCPGRVSLRIASWRWIPQEHGAPLRGGNGVVESPLVGKYVVFPEPHRGQYGGRGQISFWQRWWVQLTGSGEGWLWWESKRIPGFQLVHLGGVLPLRSEARGEYPTHPGRKIG